jgi:TPP-dependent pyruvate/acetoin dehydrogenase alpha subunit
MGDLTLNIVGFISHLPHSLPVALGAAMSFVYRDEPRVALTFTGDGASSAGLFHETLNLAAVWNAPLVVIVENNLYAYSTPLDQQMKSPNIAERAAAYGMAGLAVDGNDVEAVYAVTQEAVARARRGGGPTMIEAKTMRMLGHAIHDGAEYVPKELLAEWEGRDPVKRYRARLLDAGIAEEADLAEIAHRVEVEIANAVAYAEADPLPDPATVEQGVYAGE